MCDDCRRQKAEVKEEILQLVSGEGELFEELAQAAEEEFEDEQERQDALDAIVAEGIAQRAAFMAAYCPDTPTHNLLPFVILGMWAHQLMQLHVEETRERQFRNIFGLGLN
jgi:hypothetical protein